MKPNGHHNPAQLELPQFTLPAIILPGARAGEWIVKPGKPVLVEKEISIREASRILGLSINRIRTMCDEGNFKEGVDWNQPSGPRGKYFLKLSSVLARKQISIQ